MTLRTQQKLDVTRRALEAEAKKIKMAERVLIAGCGSLGNAVGARLVRAGFEVWGLRRTTGLLDPALRPLVADLNDPHGLPALPSALDFVLYTASADGRSDDAYRKTYVEGLANLLDSLQRQGQKPRRVIFTSSTAVYGQQAGEWVDESSPTEPDQFTGHRLLEGEQRLREGPFPATVLRLGGIYGPGRTRLIEQVWSGEAACVAGETIYSNRIHVEDCAGILQHLMQPSPAEEIYLGVDSEPADRCQVLHWLAQQLKVPPPGLISRDSASARTVGSNKRCRNRRVCQSGYRFHYPTFREGYREMVKQFLKNHQKA